MKSKDVSGVGGHFFNRGEQGNTVKSMFLFYVRFMLSSSVIYKSENERRENSGFSRVKKSVDVPVL